MVGGMVTWTTAVAVLCAAAMLVAEIVMLRADATFGALSRPAEEMLPALVDQITPDSPVPVTVALNCSDSPDPKFALVGEIWMMTRSACVDTPERIVEQAVDKPRLNMRMRQTIVGAMRTLQRITPTNTTLGGNS